MSSVDYKDVDFGDHGVIYITPDKPSTEWDKASTGALVQILLKQFQQFSEGKISSKRRLYDNASAQMLKKGFVYTSAQCENKWKSLKRRYLTKYERLLQGEPLRGIKKPRQSFDDEIEHILMIEKPAFKQEIEKLTNLNIPPGFIGKSEEIDDHLLKEEDIDDMDEYIEQEQEYTQNDEELVKMILKGNEENDSDQDTRHSTFTDRNINYSYIKHDPTAEDSTEEKYSTQLQRQSKHNDRVVRELKDLKRVLKRTWEANTQILKNQNTTHEQILTCLDTLEKREEEKMELKKRKLERQGEMVQQMKIQNSLIAKLIQKIGGNNGSSSNG